MTTMYELTEPHGESAGTITVGPERAAQVALLYEQVLIEIETQGAIWTDATTMADHLGCTELADICHRHLRTLQALRQAVDLALLTAMPAAGSA